jgi:hypothetical protein
LTREVLEIGLVIASAAFVSTWLTKSILSKISEGWFRKIGFSAMVLSGCMLLQQSVKDLLTDRHVSLEFEYNEGFELEQEIPITELSSPQQQMVKAHRSDADKIVIEIVYAIGKRTSYEAYYYHHNRLLEKYSFD